MKIFVITMLSALVATIIIDGCISQSSAATIRVARTGEKVIRRLGEKWGIFSKHNEILKVKERSPQEFGQLDSFAKVPKLHINDDGEYVVHLKTISGSHYKELQDSLAYISKRRQEIFPTNADKDEILPIMWRKSFAMDDSGSVRSISRLDVNQAVTTEVEEELLFAINAHDTAARLAATARSLTGMGDLSEVERHLHKIVDLLDATPSAQRVVGFPDTQGNIVEFFDVTSSARLEVSFINEQDNIKRWLLSSSSASDVNEIARRYVLYLSN